MTSSLPSFLSNCKSQRRKLSKNFKKKILTLVKKALDFQVFLRLSGLRNRGFKFKLTFCYVTVGSPSFFVPIWCCSTFLYTRLSVLFPFRVYSANVDMKSINYLNSMRHDTSLFLPGVTPIRLSRSPVTRLVPVGLALPEIRPTETCLGSVHSGLPILFLDARLTSSSLKFKMAAYS